MIGLPIIWRLRTLEHLRVFLFGGYGLALAALALAVFGVIECFPFAFTKARDVFLRP